MSERRSCGNLLATCDVVDIELFGLGARSGNDGTQLYGKDLCDVRSTNPVLRNLPEAEANNGYGYQAGQTATLPGLSLIHI